MKSSRQGTISRAQDVLDQFVSAVSDLGLPPLGPEFKQLAGSDLTNALVAHRVTNKYVKLDTEGDRLRSLACIQEVILNDNLGPTGFSLMPGAMDDSMRLLCIRAKHRIAEILKDFRLPSVATRFPTGESCRSAKGLTGFAGKFNNDTQWTCSASAFKYAAELCYNTLSLKRMVRDRFRQKYPHRFLRDQWGDTSDGFKTFKRMFASVVDIECSVYTTVPKNNTSDRVISMEPTFSMIAQLQLSKGLRECLLRDGYDITNRAVKHGDWIRHKELATIDLSKASDSNWLTVIESLWPPRIVRLLKELRTDTISYKGKSGETLYTYPKMLSPMGNGFTFEVMTITLMALCQVLDPDASVFGDDIIIRASKAPLLLRLLDATGWKINESKSFIDGNFRESCGKYHDVFHDLPVLSYDFTYPTTRGDCLIAANKLYRLLNYKGSNRLSGPLRTLCLKTWLSLHQIFPEYASDDTSEDLSDKRLYSFYLDYSFERDHSVKALYNLAFHRPAMWRLDNVTKPLLDRSDKVDTIRYAAFLLNGSNPESVRNTNTEYAEWVDALTGYPRNRVS